jgi:hypothetical protein
LTTMKRSSLRGDDLKRRINESVKQFYSVVVIAVGLAFVLSFAGSLLVNEFSNIDFIRRWYVWIILGVLVVLLLCFLWQFTAPVKSYHENATLKLLINKKQNEVLWSPSWTYMAGAVAHQTYEILEKGLSTSESEHPGYSSGETWIQDLPGYLLLRWLSSFGLTCRPGGIKIRRVELSELPRWIGQANRLVDLSSKLGTPRGFLEASLSQLTVEMPEGLRISTPTTEQVNGYINSSCGIAISNLYGKIEILFGPMFPSFQFPITRSGPAPSIDGMPINAASTEYYLQQLHDIVVTSWPIGITELVP